MPFDGTQLNETAAHLLRAKRYLEQHGWRQDSYGKAGDPLCILGALFLTKENNELSYQTCYAFLQQVTESERPSLWQDAPERTITEVYAAFDRAIALAMEAADA